MSAGEMDRLEGIFTPLLVPLDERGQINEPEFRRFVSWLIEQGVHGLYPNGSTGEFTRFTPEERRLHGYHARPRTEHADREPRRSGVDRSSIPPAIRQGLHR